MSREIVISPVTRIEGHAKITIQLDGDGHVADARFHVTQVRGFEKFCEGRPFTEMPSITARTCGICPVSHLLASAKACDALLTVWIPETALNLRRVLNLLQLVQSHALSFFYLSAPDFLIGMDSDPARRNILGMLEQAPQLMRDGVLLRRFGQQGIERLAGKRVHPAWVVPGGVARPLAPEDREAILREIPDAMAAVRRGLDWYKHVMDNFRAEMRTFANFPSMFMGLVGPEGELSHYSGRIRFIDETGKMVQDRVDHARYQDFIGEAVESFSYLKSPYFKPRGYPGGMYRVGPLARLNVVDRCGTPLADMEWAEFRELERGANLSSFHYHFARLIEIVYGLERIKLLLESPSILDSHVRAFAEPNAHEGVGVSEAPRGTLIHHYKIDDNGLIVWANLIIATGHNSLAMNRGILQAARQYIKADSIEEGALNRVEAVIRCFDPCLSCSTHAVGKMPLEIDLLDAAGRLLDRIARQ